MSSQPKKKKTVAQARAEKEQRSQDVEEGCLIAADVTDSFIAWQLREKNGGSKSFGGSHDRVIGILDQANRAYELLRHHAEFFDRTAAYARVALVKGTMHGYLGEYTLALETFRHADEFFIEADGEGLIAARHRGVWKDIVAQLAEMYASSHQNEAAKQCCLRLIAWPYLISPLDRVNGFQGLAGYRKQRKEWDKVIEYCEKALPIAPQAQALASPSARIEERLLLLLAEAAEEQGNIERALEYDVLVRKLWTESKITLFLGLAGCYRRDALMLLAAGEARGAAQTLAHIPLSYENKLKDTGLNMAQLHTILPLVAALKVLADALIQMGAADCVAYAGRIRADVAETEAILAGYWEGVLEETRRELREQRVAAVTAAATEGAEDKRCGNEEKQMPAIALLKP